MNDSEKIKKKSRHFTWTEAKGPCDLPIIGIMPVKHLAP